MEVQEVLNFQVQQVQIWLPIEFGYGQRQVSSIFVVWYAFSK